MSVTKEQFITSLQEVLNSDSELQSKLQVTFSKKEVKRIYELLINEIVTNLSTKDEFKLYGLGRFYTRKIKVGLPAGHPFLKPGQSPNQREERTIGFKPYPSSREFIN